ncbi:hypothetical protein BGY98DRAFT_935363 [Russula aff. rugulosa BPL654]|nr:hypothetical protein BGY98DRAFT_935363 [Russula aff. rugulosa BPL654]
MAFCRWNETGRLLFPEACFSLFYKVTKDSHDARHINLANVTPDELEQLAQACEPASFGRDKEDVLDETYRKAGKMKLGHFSLNLDPRVHITGNIWAELYKFNVYSKGSFFKPHVDTLHSEKMFGSLVIVLPTPHEEWTFDSGPELTTERQPSIRYAAFFSDIEHEVTPVISGHRVTLTYNLYFDDIGPTTISEHSVSRPLLSTQANPEFLADGGTLAFGLRHVYPIKDSLEHLYGVLKGCDAVVYQTVRALGFEPVLSLYYEWEPPWSAHLEGVLIDEVIDFSCVRFPNEAGDFAYVLREKGGLMVHRDGWGIDRRFGCETPEHVDWVTPVTTFNRKTGAFATYGNEAILEMAYGDVCLVVRIGKAGRRLEYPTLAQLKRATQQVDRTSAFWRRNDP